MELTVTAGDVDQAGADQGNPFDKLDGAMPAGPVMQPADRPTLTERFQANYAQSRYVGTTGGAIAGKYTESYDRERALALYDALPQWETPIEGAAALAGQLAAQGPWNAPENILPFALGEKMLGWAGVKTATTGARIAAGAIDAGAANLATDAAIQAIEQGAGTRDGFDPGQLLASTALGSAIGGGARILGHMVFGDHAPIEHVPERPGESPAGDVNTPKVLTPEVTPEAAPDVSLPPPAVIHAPTLGEGLDQAARLTRGLPERPPAPDPLADVAREMHRELQAGAPEVPRKPQTLSQYLAQKGGLAADGDLRALDAHLWFGPGGRLMRAEGGMSLDQARQLAIEGGYLHDAGRLTGGQAQTTTDDLLQALSKDLGGDPQYSAHDGDLVAAAHLREAYVAAKSDLDRALAEVRDAITTDLPNEVKRRAVEIAAQDGVQGADALERAIMEDYHANGEPEPHIRDDGSETDISFLDEPRGADQRGALPRARGGGGSAAQGGSSAPGGQSRNSGGGARASGQGVLAVAQITGPHRGQMGRPAQGTPAAVGIMPQFTRLMDIANRLTDALDAHAVRQGRITMRKALGTYNQKSGVIRIKSADDFDVLTHELGHHLETEIGAPVKALMKAHAGELTPLAYAGARKGTELKEGFAEFIRLMMTNPAYAAREAPNFNTAFRALLAKDHPDIHAAMTEGAAAWRDWLDQPSAEAVASTIVSAKEPKYFAKAKKSLDRYGLGKTIADRLSRAYTMLFDDLNPLAKAGEALAQIHQENTGRSLNLKAIDDPYKLARLSRGAWNAGHADISFGVTPYHGLDPATASLRDALIMAMGKPNVLSGWDEEAARRFGSYLWSRRALGEWDRFDMGLIPNPPDKLTKGDHATNVAESEAAYPHFIDAARMVHEFATGLWTKKRDAGLITEAQYQAGLEIKDYVPGLRAFDQDADAAARVPGKKGGAPKAGFVKRFKGSRRDVINPIESMMADAYETAMAISRNDVVKALDRMARIAGPGGGAIAERIPSHQIRGMTVDPLEAIESAAKDAGMHQADAVVLRDAIEAQIGDAKATIFRPGVINEKGEPIVFWRDGGELQALRLADGAFGREMYSALTMMSRHEKSLFLDMLAKPAAIARLGITADPNFIIANFIRDQATAWVFYGNPLKRVMRTIQGAGQDLFRSEAARRYNAAGGIMGGANVAGLHDVRIRRDINALKAEGWAAKRLTSFKGILEATEISETAMRLGLFRDFTDEAKARGLSEIEAIFEGAYRSRDYLDFDRRGTAMPGIARLVPFLNAALQGSDKINRQMIAPLFGGAADPKARGDAMKAWARLSAATVATLGLTALMSQNDAGDEYKDFSPDLRAQNWVVKWGKNWLVIPKPFEMAAVLNLGEAAWDAIARHDPRWASNYVQGLIDVGMPPNVMEGNPAIMTAYELAFGQDIKTGQQLVPDDLKGLEPWLQFTAATSELGKEIGKALNVSPAIIDHVFTNFSTSYGRNALALYDYALSDKPLPGWDDMVFTRRFIKDGSRGASSTRAFWAFVSDRTGSLEGARKSWQTMMDAGDVTRAQDYLAAQDETHRAWIAAGPLPADARRLHPFGRAKLAVQAISALRREMSGPVIATADGPVTIERPARGAADDILGDLAMVEARNALVMMQAKGYEGRTLIDTQTYFRELEAISPDLRRALGDRFASKKVPPFTVVRDLWPEFENRLLHDGSDAVTGDLTAEAKSEGYELSGAPIKRKKRTGVPGQ